MFGDSEPLRKEFHQYAIPRSEEEEEQDFSKLAGQVIDINDPQLTTEIIEIDPEADAFARWGTLNIRVDADDVKISAVWREC